jgi:hypothetical protein
MNDGVLYETDSFLAFLFVLAVFIFDLFFGDVFSLGLFYFLTVTLNFCLLIRPAFFMINVFQLFFDGKYFLGNIVGLILEADHKGYFFGCTLRSTLQ